MRAPRHMYHYTPLLVILMSFPFHWSSQGPLPLRLQSTCMARALSLIHRRTLRVFWLSDNAVEDVPFSSLFSRQPFVFDTDISQEEAARRFSGRPFTPVEVGPG